MVRTRPADRLDEITVAARTVFAKRGFVNARMADVATLAGVSQGLLYTYVESKDALALCVVEREAAGAPVTPAELPLPDPPPGLLEERIAEALGKGMALPALRSAVKHPKYAADELEGIIREIYASLNRWRWLITIVERTANDDKAVRTQVYAKGRRPLVASLARYLEGGMSAGSFRPFAHPDVAARFVMEGIAYFANHRYGDLDSADISDEAAEETAVAMLLASLVVS